MFQFTTVLQMGTVQRGGGGGGGTLIFSYIRRLENLFWVKKIESQYFLGFSEK